MTSVRNDWVFSTLVAAFVGVFLVYYPATYAIDDECNILSLAFSITHGTVFLDQAGIDLDADLLWAGHRISKFSPFHAALLVPALMTHWRLAFLVSATFFLWGAFILRDMFRREGLSSGWVLLYCANPGLLYYSRTLLAMVPAAVMGLLGASLLFRPHPRPVAAAAALGAAALLHIWLLPVAVALSVGWFIEMPRARLRGAGALVLGALPAVVMLALYDWVTTGSPFLNAYWIIGHQRTFHPSHTWNFLPFYLISLSLAPPYGCVALSRRWAGNWTIPAAVGLLIAAASTYYYRDGTGYGLAGWVPGQRFLLPAALLACLPAARCLSASIQPWQPPRRVLAWAQVAAVCTIVGGWLLLSACHQAYLEAHATLQAAIVKAIPNRARVVGNDHTFKEFAPVNGAWRLSLLRDGQAPAAEDVEGAYAVWLSPPNQPAPSVWFAGRQVSVTRVRSWVWARDLWIAAPTAAAIAREQP